MLEVIKSLRNLSFSQLMQVYADANRENGAEHYPCLSLTEQIYEAEQEFYCYLESVFFKQSDSFYCVWVNGDNYCSALRLEPYRDGLLLCALETAPDRRRRGYAEKLIRSVQHYLSSYGDGVIYSHVSKKNVASLRTHQKCGFTVAGDYAVYSDGSVTHSNYTFIYKYKKSERS